MLAHSFAEIEPYCYLPVRIDKDRFGGIKAFIEEELKLMPLYAAIHQDYSSSARFQHEYARDWKNLEPFASPDLAHFKTRVYASHRGPFVTSLGLELQPREDSYHAISNDDFVFRSSSIAETKAQQIAQAVANHFGLTYLDRLWLSQQPLSLEKLSADATSEIDDYEPTALNVLFTCYP